MKLLTWLLLILQGLTVKGEIQNTAHDVLEKLVSTECKTCLGFEGDLNLSLINTQGDGKELNEEKVAKLFAQAILKLTRDILVD